jgi:hypothetical protein
MSVKGYRTPSWFRMKGFASKKRAKADRDKLKVSKSKRVTGRELR